MTGPGEAKLRRAIRRINRPQWLSDRIRALQDQQHILRSTINKLETQQIMHGANVPSAIFAGLDQAREQLSQVEEELDVLLSGWDAIAAQAEHVQL